mgnify:CR=1 FL=1
MFFVYAIVRFLLQALALKFSVSLIGQPGVQNNYTQALTTSAILGVLSLLCGCIPVFGWLLYLGLWCAVVMNTYKLSFTRSVGVAIIQTLIAFGLLKLLVLINILPAATSL